MLPWQSHYVEPEVFARANYFHVLVQVSRFFDVAISVQFVNPRNIALRFRGCENNNGNPAQRFVLFYLEQDFTAIFFGRLRSRKMRSGFGAAVYGCRRCR